ncbi:hypothetical protein [Microbulbifer taiwanensis]|uniref:hypothetical protein n=1 Tax=Microbulbifer taiwanensis TaxID=986746 RepID=UPI001867C0CC
MATAIAIVALVGLFATGSVTAKPPFLQQPLPVSEGTPIQLSFRGVFLDGNPFLTEAAGFTPRLFTVPGRKSLLIKYVNCTATRQANETHQFVISLRADHLFEGADQPLPDSVVSLVPTAIFEGQFSDRAVVSAPVHAYVNIPSPAAGAPAIDDLLTLTASRNGTTGIGEVFCSVSGVLFPK